MSLVEGLANGELLVKSGSGGGRLLRFCNFVIFFCWINSYEFGGDGYG